MKNIFVPVELHSSVESVLATAVLVGRRLEGYIEGVALGPDMPDLVAFDLPVSWTLADQNSWRELNEESHRRFEDFMTQQGVPIRQGVSVNGCSQSWSGDRSLGDSQIGNYARLFDLSIVGRPGAERGNPRMSTTEAALFETGRPIILAPPEPPAKIGETIVIAWTQSVESARTTALAMPLLQLATKVNLLTITDHGIEDQAAGHMAEMLQGNAVAAEVVVRSGKGKSLGEAWLEEAEALGADLLIKGGYTRSRLRQMIFGDATNHILTRAELPVLMAV